MKQFDLRDTIVPFTLLEVINHFNGMACGDRMEILSDDTASIADLRSILPPGAFELSFSCPGIPKIAENQIIIRKVC